MRPGDIARRLIDQAEKANPGAREDLYDGIYEMANIPKRIHKLGLDIKFNVLQPADKKIKHAERVKVFKGDDLTNSFYYSLTVTPPVPEGRDIFLHGKDLRRVTQWVAKYQKALLTLWNKPAMDLDQFELMMAQIDRGEI